MRAQHLIVSLGQGLGRFGKEPGSNFREQGDAGGNRKNPVEWPVPFAYHSNPEKSLYARQTTTRHL